VTTWFKNLLQEGVQKLILNSLLIRKSSPPGQIRGFKTDGSNLPWVIDDLKKRSFPQFNAWIEHIRTALPDISDIQIIEREEDKHKYLEICYQTGLRIPSWMASDGTLRLLALTLPAYLNDIKGIYLIEEPKMVSIQCIRDCFSVVVFSIWRSTIISNTLTSYFKSCKPRPSSMFQKSRIWSH
jgi:hypothetical protein